MNTERILAQMRALGYKTNIDGMCYGFAIMSAQALLAEDKLTYDNRLSLLETIPAHKLGDCIDKVKLKVKTKKPLTKDEELLLSVPAFFDGVALSFRPSEYPQIFHTKYTPAQDAIFSFPMTLPKTLESKGVIKITEFSGVYQHEELEDFFRILTQKYRHIEPSFPIALTFHTAEHAVSFGYNTDTQFWEYSNDLETGPIYFDSDFAYTLERILSGAEFTPFGVMMYVQQEHQYQAESLVDALNHDEQWRQLHEINEEKIHALNEHGLNWLMMAANINQISLVQTLLERGADPNVMSKDKKKCALLIAAQKGYTEITELLLSFKGNANIESEDGLTALRYAVSFGHIEIVKLLLQHQAKPLKAIEDAIYKDDGEVFDLLLTTAQKKLDDADEDVDKKKQTFITYILWFGAINILKFYLNKDKTTTSELLKKSDLHYPVILGYTEIVELLLIHGVDTQFNLTLEELISYLPTEEAKQQFSLCIQAPRPQLSIVNSAIIFGHQKIMNLLLEHQPELLNQGLDCVDLAISMKHYFLIHGIVAHLKKQISINPINAPELQSQLELVLNKQNLHHLQALKTIYFRIFEGDSNPSLDNLFDYFEQYQTFDLGIYLGCILSEQGRCNTLCSYFVFLFKESSYHKLMTLFHESSEYLKSEQFLIPSKSELTSAFQNIETYHVNSTLKKGN